MFRNAIMTGHRPKPPLEIESNPRRRLLDHVAAQIPYRHDEACVLVGVDGPDGSGKTIFADQLAATVRETGRAALRVSLDDFHNRRQVRYRLGRASAVGFWLDSYDYPRFVADVLDPLGPSGDRRYRSVAHDLESDRVLDPPWQDALTRSVVIIDGLFLHRVELADRWDFSVLLDVPFDVTAARMAVRDGTAADPDHPSMRRYVDAQRIYVSECSPASRASLVIDHSDVDEPTIYLGCTSERGADQNDLTLDMYESETARYLANSSPPPEEVRRYLDDFAGLVAGGHVLELGSGPGWDADYLEQRGLRVTRTDATPSFVERLRTAGHNAQVLDARSTDYGGPFGAVLANAVLLHLKRDAFENALHTARRAVGNDGVLGLTLKEGDGAAWSTAKLGRPRHFTYWREQGVTAALLRTGWTIHTLRHVEGPHEPWIFVIARAGCAAPSDA